MFANYEKAHPELAKQFKAAFADELPANWEEALPVYEEGTAQASVYQAKMRFKQSPKLFLMYGAVQLIYLVQTIQLSLMKKNSNLVLMKAVTFGLVCVNLRWLAP